MPKEHTFSLNTEMKYANITLKTKTLNKKKFAQITQILT